MSAVERRLPLPTSSARVGMQPTSLRLPAGLDFDEWVVHGQRIAGIARASAWWVGDWVNYGEEAYGRRYQDALALTGLEYGTLRNYAMVAGRFPVSRRRDTLSFGHHQLVTSMHPSEQERWLDQADAGRWSVKQLGDAIRAAGRSEATDVVPLVPVSVRVDEERRQAWAAAAEEAGLELGEWIRQTLDEAAA